MLWAKDDYQYFRREPDEKTADFMRRVRAAGKARGHTIEVELQEKEL